MSCCAGAEGGPELNVVAAEELLMHLIAGDNPLADDSGLLVLARGGAQTPMTRAETDTSAGARRSRRGDQVPARPCRGSFALK